LSELSPDFADFIAKRAKQDELGVEQQINIVTDQDSQHPLCSQEMLTHYQEAIDTVANRQSKGTETETEADAAAAAPSCATQQTQQLSTQDSQTLQLSQSVQTCVSALFIPLSDSVLALQTEVEQLQTLVKQLQDQVKFLLSVVPANFLITSPSQQNVHQPHCLSDQLLSSSNVETPVECEMIEATKSDADTAVKSYAAVAANSNQSQVPVLRRDEAVTAMYVDQHDRERRCLNVVIRGLRAESNKEDKDLVVQLFHAVSSKKFHISKVCRLGRDPANQVRPVLVTVYKNEAQWLVDNAKGLRHSTDDYTRKSIYINADMTPAQAQAAYELRCRRRQISVMKQNRVFTNTRLASTSGTAPQSSMPAHNSSSAAETAATVDAGPAKVVCTSRLVWRPRAIQPPVPGAAIQTSAATPVVSVLTSNQSTTAANVATSQPTPSGRPDRQ
jgi:hypothetical protein